jgi:hypothetical protein
VTKGGENHYGDQESPCKKSEKDHEKEITHSAMGYHLSIAMNLYHEEDLRGFVFKPPFCGGHAKPQSGQVSRAGVM